MTGTLLWEYTNYYKIKFIFKNMIVTLIFERGDVPQIFFCFKIKPLNFFSTKIAVKISKQILKGLLAWNIHS